MIDFSAISVNQMTQCLPAPSPKHWNSLPDQKFSWHLTNGIYTQLIDLLEQTFSGSNALSCDDVVSCS